MLTLLINGVILSLGVDVITRRGAVSVYVSEELSVGSSFPSFLCIFRRILILTCLMGFGLIVVRCCYDEEINFIVLFIRWNVFISSER